MESESIEIAGRKISTADWDATPESIKLLCLDRGFYSVPIIPWLKALNFPFLMPAVIRGKTGGTRALLIGRKSYATDYAINSPKYGSITCQMRVVCGYHKGFKGQHGIRYLIDAVHLAIY